MYTCRASVTLGLNDQQRATNELRAELQRKVVIADPLDLPDWTSLSMTGPEEMWGPRGEIHFRFDGSVRVSSRRERSARRP